MTEVTQATPRTLAAIINTEEGTIVSTNTDPKKATEYRLSVRELNGSVNGTKFMVVEFHTTGNNLSYFFAKFQVECENTKNQLRIWGNEAVIVGKQRLLNTAQEKLNHLNEALDEIAELYTDYEQKAELVGELITDEIREVEEDIEEIENSIRSTKNGISKLQATIA